MFIFYFYIFDEASYELECLHRRLL